MKSERRLGNNSLQKIESISRDYSKQDLRECTEQKRNKKENNITSKLLRRKARDFRF